MDRREILIVFSAGLIAFAAGYGIGQMQFGVTVPEGYSQTFDFKVNASNEPREFGFDNRSFNILLSDGGEMRAFLDINKDGSVDRLLNTTNDGEEHTTSEIVTLDGRSYRVYFRYQDDVAEEDGYVEVYRVSEIL